MIHIQSHGPVTAIRLARTFLGRPIAWTAAYWLDGLLIDSGPPCLAGQLLAGLGSLPVEQIVVTHPHEEQCGGLARLRDRFPHAQMYAPFTGLPLVQEPHRLRPSFLRRLLWGMPEGVARVEPLDVFIETDRYRLRVIDTPGHCRAHVSLFEPHNRWLFSGDAFNADRERAWSAEAEMFGTISSLRTLAALRPERLFPASGNVRRTPLPELHGKIGQLLGLCREVGKLHSAGLPTGEIVRRLLGGEPSLYYWSLGTFSAHNLARACLAYNELFQPVADGANEKRRPLEQRPNSRISSSSPE